MTEKEEDLMIKAVVAAIAIFGLYRVGQYFQNKFGIHPENTALVNAQAAKSGSTNAFSPVYKPFLDSDQGNPSSDSSFTSLKAQYDADPAKYVASRSQPIVTITRGENLWKAFSFFTGTDYPAIVNVFAGMTSKQDVAELAQFMSEIYNVDLLAFLRTGIYTIGPINWGLNDNQLAEIINHVNSLPDTPQ